MALLGCDTPAETGLCRPLVGDATSNNTTNKPTLGNLMGQIKECTEQNENGPTLCAAHFLTCSPTSPQLLLLL